MAKPKAEGAGGAPAYRPATKPYTLASGRDVTLTQPDQFALASGDINIPNSVKRDIWELLLRYVSAPSPEEQLLADERFIRAHYYMAQLVLSPRLKLDDDEEGEIDRRELSLPDLLAIYDFWRFGPPRPAQDPQRGASHDAVPPVGDGQGAE